MIADKDLPRLRYLIEHIAPRIGHHIHYLDALPALDHYAPPSSGSNSSFPYLEELSLSSSTTTARQELYAALLRLTPNLAGIDLLLPVIHPKLSPVLPVLRAGFASQLRSLSLHGQPEGRLEASWVGELLGGLPGLVQVDLAWVEPSGHRHATDDPLARGLASLPKLRRLNLTQVEHFSHSWLAPTWLGPIEDVSLKWCGPSQDHPLAHAFFALFSPTLRAVRYTPAPTPAFAHPALIPPHLTTSPLSSPTLLHLPQLTHISLHPPLTPAHLTSFLACPIETIRFTSAPHGEQEWDALVMLLEGFSGTLEKLELRVGQPSNLGYITMNDVAKWCWEGGIAYKLDRWEEGEEGRVVWVTD